MQSSETDDSSRTDDSKPVMVGCSQVTCFQSLLRCNSTRMQLSIIVRYQLIIFRIAHTVITEFTSSPSYNTADGADCDGLRLYDSPAVSRYLIGRTGFLPAMLRPSTLLVLLLACLASPIQARQLQQAKSSKTGPTGLACSNYIVMTTNIPALGTTEQLGDSVSASINCATRPAPLATLGGRCSIVCDEPADLKRVMITDENLMAAPANYLKSAVKDKDVEFVDPVFCQLTVTDAPLKGECQLRAQALCCAA